MCLPDIVGLSDSASLSVFFDLSGIGCVCQLLWVCQVAGLSSIAGLSGIAGLADIMCPQVLWVCQVFCLSTKYCGSVRFLGLSGIVGLPNIVGLSDTASLSATFDLSDIGLTSYWFFLCGPVGRVVSDRAFNRRKPDRRLTLHFRFRHWPLRRSATCPSIRTKVQANT